MSETAKPRVYGFCDAGCRRETVLREDFLRSASLYEIYPDSGGKWHLEKKKQYKIFAPKDENGAFSFVLYVNHIIDKHYITTTTNDEYADWFVFRLLDYKFVEGTQYKVVYEIEGNRYTEIIADGGDAIDGIVLSGATQVFLFNDDATVIARDGADGEDGNADAVYYTVEIPTADTADSSWSGTDENGYSRGLQTPFDATAAVFPSCDDDAIFTDCGLSLNYDEQGEQWVIGVTAYPSSALTVTLLFIPATNGGAL